MSRKRRSRSLQERESQSSANISSSRSNLQLALRRILLVAAPACIFLALGLDYMWVTEDAYITFQSVENLWAGYGPNFNRGLRVESFSHPLWFIILCVLRFGGSETLPLLAALTGIAFSVAGLALAAEAARIRLQERTHSFPIGALAIAALPPFWQFASSGLETGLTFFWLGGCSWLLTQMPNKTSWVNRHAWWLMGLGPTIRPDLGIFTVFFLPAALLLVSKQGASLSGILKGVAICAIPATAWQIFRMGYYGAIVPNTYLAKEGLGTRWDQGLIYLDDLCNTYLLWPLLFCGITLIILTFTRSPARHYPNHNSSRYPIYALWAGALIHGTLVCRAGGDFMHARLLLPSLFALLASCAITPLPQPNLARWSLLTLLAAWLGYISLFARPIYGSHISSNGIADERQFYVQTARSSRPTSLKDYELHQFYRVGEAATKMLLTNNFKAMYWGHIGITVAAVPDDIIVIDPLALNDHIGSRIELVTRGRPGHEKIVPAAWFFARYPPGIGFVVSNQLKGAFSKKETAEEVNFAKIALQTPPLRELTEAVSAPMSPSLFAQNLLRAWRLSFMRIPPKPADAVQKFFLPTLSIPGNKDKPVIAPTRP